MANNNNMENCFAILHTIIETMETIMETAAQQSSLINRNIFTIFTSNPRKAITYSKFFYQYRCVM